MNIQEVIAKLSYHHQMAAGWEYLDEHLVKFLSDSVTEVIPVTKGVEASQVTLKCVQEILNDIRENGKAHRTEISTLEALDTKPPIKLADVKKAKEVKIAQDG